MTGVELLQRTLDGWLDGSSYALVGIGFTLTFGTLRRLNLAYGAGAMLAAYAGSWLFAAHGVPAVVVALIVVGLAALIGLYVERLCFATAPDNVQDGATQGAATGTGFDAREVVALASSFAIWMQLEQLAVNLLPSHLNIFPSFAVNAEWTVAGLQLRADRLLLAALAVALALGLAHWIATSRTGLAWRAAATQRTAAHLVGMPVVRHQALAFAVACGLSGVAGFAVLAIEGQVTPMFGMWVLVKGLVAAMLGGLGSIRGVLVGGWVLGIVEAHAQALFGAVGREFATYALLFVVLVLVRPHRRSGWLASGANDAR